MFYRLFRWHIVPRGIIIKNRKKTEPIAIFRGWDFSIIRFVDATADRRRAGRALSAGMRSMRETGRFRGPADLPRLLVFDQRDRGALLLGLPKVAV